MQSGFLALRSGLFTDASFPALRHTALQQPQKAPHYDRKKIRSRSMYTLPNTTNKVYLGECGNVGLKELYRMLEEM